jgi:bifunctional non-homologous end joining protein LigD
MLATPVKEPFDRKGWLFEIKWDGYRAFAIKNKSVMLLSRGKKSYNLLYPSLVNELKKLPGKFVLDGEIVILDDQGRSNFQLLQNYQKTKEGTPYFYLFDLLFLDGEDLTDLPLVERKKRLKKLLRGTRFLRFSDDIRERGKAFFRAAEKKGLEGIIAKRGDSKYQFHRSKDWLKIKASLGQEVVIGGYTEPRGSRKRFGALLIGVYEKGKLIYAGHVGTGFDRRLLEDVYALLTKNASSQCPFVKKPKANAPVVWVKPKLVCEVSFREWTKEGILRQPVFKGIREDKTPKQVKRERAQ